MDATTRFDTQIIGALPVITKYLERLNMANIIDDIVPYEGDVPLGTLVEVMVINRLLQPQALFRVGEWAENAAVTDYFDLTAEQLNDDRLGRALERIADHRLDVQTALTTAAIKKFRLDVSQRPKVQAASDRLRSVGISLFGAVVNGAKSATSHRAVERHLPAST